MGESVEGEDMYKDPVNSLKTELENVKARRKELEEALERLVAERQRTAESLSRLAGGVTVDKKSSTSTLLGAAILSLLAIPLTGIVLSRFWDWFVVGLFDLPQISAVEATGICLLISIFLSYHKITSKDVSRIIVERILRLGITWFLGWLLHWLI